VTRGGTSTVSSVFRLGIRTSAAFAAAAHRCVYKMYLCIVLHTADREAAPSSSEPRTVIGLLPPPHSRAPLMLHAGWTSVTRFRLATSTRLDRLQLGGASALCLLRTASAIMQSSRCHCIMECQACIAGPPARPCVEGAAMPPCDERCYAVFLPLRPTADFRARRSHSFRLRRPPSLKYAAALLPPEMELERALRSVRAQQHECVSVACSVVIERRVVGRA